MVFTVRLVQQHQIGVGIGCDIPPTQSAMRDEGHRFKQIREAHVLTRLVEQVEHDTVDDVGHPSANLNTGCSRRMLLVQLPTARRKLLLCRVDGGPNSASHSHAVPISFLPLFSHLAIGITLDAIHL